MTKGRAPLIALSLAAFNGVAWLVLRRLRPRQPKAPDAAAYEHRLRTDLDRVKARVYSEEGVPMFLACENLALPAMTRPALNESLVSAFRRDADAWLRIWPDSPGTEMCRLIEVLADRDFTSGGAEWRL